MIFSLLDGSFSLVDFFISIMMRLPAVLLAISVHEAAHGYIAYKLGDPTAKLMGRVTINPLAHFDLFGAIFMLLFGFGWAKPVPFDSRHLKHPRRDSAFIALAGPVSNLLVAFLFCGIRFALIGFTAVQQPEWLLEGSMFTILSEMLDIIVIMNLSLMIFNLIPLPPLDGSKVLFAFLPARAIRVMFYLEKYGMSILMIWIIVGKYLPSFLSLTHWLSWVVIHLYSYISSFWFEVISLFIR